MILCQNILLTNLWRTNHTLLDFNYIAMSINSLLEYVMYLPPKTNHHTQHNTTQFNNTQKESTNLLLVQHTIFRCRSPLISIASTLSNEHRTAGKVTSNCNPIATSNTKIETKKRKRKSIRTWIRSFSSREVSTKRLVWVTVWRYMENSETKRKNMTREETRVISPPENVRL